MVPPGDAGALSRALDDVLAQSQSGAGTVTGTSTEARKEATEYAREWSMDTLAERYVEMYGRAIDAHRAGH